MSSSINELTHSRINTFLKKIFVAVGDFVGATHHEVGGCVVRLVEVVGHDVGDPAKGVLLLVVEMTHEEEADVVGAHQVKKFVVLLLGQVGSGSGAVVVAGAEQAGVGGDHHVAVLVAVLQEVAKPLQLAAAPLPELPMPATLQLMQVAPSRGITMWVALSAMRVTT